MSGGMPWTVEDDKVLIQCVKNGQEHKVVAKLLGRTPDAVHTRVSVLRKAGIEIPNTKRTARCAHLKALTEFAASLEGQS